MGLIITELKKRKPELPYFDESFEGEYPEEAPFTISELEEIYPTASAYAKEHDDYREEALHATYLLQNGYKGYRAIWKHIMNVSVTDLKKNYERLSVDFDLWKGEADAQAYIPDMVEMLKEKGFAHYDEGALVVDVAEETDKKEIPPCMILKSDGAALYDTTDLATLVEREKLYDPDQVIYVVDKRQELHFVQVFRCAKKTGIVKPETLVTKFEEPEDVKIFDGFIDMEEATLKELYASLNLAMTFKDFQHIQNYFKSEEDRDPSMTEIRVLDTYWSDHCRHTTFSTELTDVSFSECDYREPMEETYKQYIADHSEIFKGREDKFVCLMDLALMAMRKLKREGKLQDQEESDEINACSIVVPIEVDGVEEEWLVNFKNETHNHPTEIEPFGGAATCLGGAIRDPLSGRTYVYQEMRVT